MCGIAGIAQLSTGEPVERSLLGRMTQRLAHRGTDDDGILVDRPGGLGHLRLAIVDPEALYHYLTFFTTPAPSTLFDGIRKLPPGHLLTWDGRSQPVLRPYWRLAEAALRTTRTESDWVEAVRERVKLAVDGRMMSDV